ncbi:acyclic terpene utilization AtuA family protein [Bradyrhizobium sp.]|uniref:acyclic terpene utilization AtuA family protein n=1 Tax=Bradyrhizobium sp. TaxID=376 RepID=UPI0039E463FC
MTVRIGCGAGFAGDRIDPAKDLAARGRLDYLIFECMAERTLALGQLARRQNPNAGFNNYLVKRLEAVLPDCCANKTRIVTNMGVANPERAAQVTLDVARKLGLGGFKVAVVKGDDVADLISKDTMLPELGKTIGETGLHMISANAYLGADIIGQALDEDPAIVLTGRVADPSLVVAPLAHEFGWRFDNWQEMAQATLIGHVLECGGLVTGGYFADPGYKSVPDLAYIGFPLAEVEPDGSAIITKLPDTGGVMIPHIVKEQLFYEVHDPKGYKTPDVVANFASVKVSAAGPDRVAVHGATGQPRPDTLKVTVGFDGGYLAEVGISYAGPGAVDRGRLAAQIIRERMENLHGRKEELRLDLIGQNSLHGSATASAARELEDVRVRGALRSFDRETAEVLLYEVEALLNNGPAGGGGYRGTITPSVITHAAFVGRAAVKPTFEVFST